MFLAGQVLDGAVGLLDGGGQLGVAARSLSTAPRVASMERTAWALTWACSPRDMDDCLAIAA